MTRNLKSQISDLVGEIVRFRDKRDWGQFHNAKDLSLAISVEASELAQLFLWKNPTDVSKTDIALELADVLIYSMLLAHESQIDLLDAIRRKMEINRKKYPVSKSKGNNKKYNEF